MAIFPSPFSTNVPTGAPTPSPVGGGGVKPSPFSTPMGTAKGVNYGGTTLKNKTTAEEEKMKLQSAFETISQRIATGSGDTEALLKEAKRVAAQGGKADTSRGIWGWVKKSVVQPILEPINYVMESPIPFSGGATVGGELGAASRYVQSAGMFVAEPAGNLVQFAWGKKDWKDLNWTSVSEAWSRANDPNWGVFKDPKYKTGNKWIDGIGQFVTDVATDPATYVTLGASEFAGAAGRRALRDMFAETAMRNLYPEMAGKLDDIERYGIWAIPKDIRDAEGLKTGIKFAGKVIPLTDTPAEVLATPFIKARTSIGDAVYNVAPKALEFVTPKSARAGVAAGLGRDLGIADEQVVQIAASHSAASYLKGARNVAYADHVAGVRDIVSSAEKANIEQDVRKAVENAAFYEIATPEVQQLADSFKIWQTKLRDGVNDIYRKFGIDYGSDIKEIAFVDDYIHHKITPEARSWIFSPKNVTSKKWNPSDLSVEELTSAVGAARYRKARLGGEFMGVAIDTPEKATIDGLNKIAYEQTGVKEWFDTSLASIADSYSYSMAAAKGREAWARRMMDFGSDTIRTIADKTIPDKELLDSLKATHAKLMRSEAIMKAKVVTGLDVVQKGTKRFGERAQQLAKRVLDGNIKQTAMTEREIANVQKLLSEIDAQLQDVHAVAAAKTAEQRGSFDVVHKELIRQRQRLATALAKGDATELAVREELQKIYAVVFPNAKSAPDDINVMAERILQRDGIPASRELREAKARLTSIREQLDTMPTTKEFDGERQALIDAQLSIEDHIAGFDKLAEVRTNASYAPDGLLYGTEDALIPLPDGVAPYKVLHTVPDRAMLDNPQSVAVHAFDERSLIDLRHPEDFRNLFAADNGLPQGLPEYIANGMDNAGLDSQTFYEEFKNFMRTGQIDPMFVEMYPEETKLIQTIDFLNNMPIPDTGLSHGMIQDAFNALNESFRGVASQYNPEFSDEIARQIVDDVISAHIHFSDQIGMIAPRAISDGIYDSPEEVYSVLLGTNYGDNLPKKGVSNATDVVQRTADSSFVQSIANADYETASLNASMEFRAAADQIMQNELGLASRQTLEQQARIERGRIGGSARAAQQRVDTTIAQLEEYAKTGKIRTTIDGKRVTLDEQVARDMLAKADAKYSSAEKRMLKEISRIEQQAGTKAEKLLKKQMDYNERLGLLMDQKATLKNWNDEVGALLQNEVDNLNEILRMRPPKGAGAEQTRIWQRQVQQSIETMNVLPENERKIYQALTTINHADETKLAWLSTQAIPEVKMLMKEAKSGDFGGTVIKDILDGWQQIEALGVQVPKEILDSWRPNLIRLQQLASKGEFAKGWDWYMRFFKTYAMMSTGFVVRNAMSATVNNYIAGVTTRNIIRGVQAMTAINKHGEAWLEQFPEAERAILDEARRVAAASSGGQVSELAEPVIGRTWAERAINNKATGFFRKLNENAETAVRFPLALESLEQGMSFDQALARVTRYHFDYSDLTKLDEKAKQIVPFWLWSTRNIPLQVANQWTRPGVYLTHKKIMDRVPPQADLFVPRWMTEMNAMRLGATNWVAAPDFPFNRLSGQVEQFTNPQRLVGQVNPLIRVPLEMIANKQFATDVPFTDKYQEAKGVDAAVAYLGNLLGFDWIGKRDSDGTLMISNKASYIPNAMIPSLATAQRLTGGAAGGKTSYKERQLSSLANWFGIPIRKIGEQQQRSEAINRQFSLKNFAKVLEDRGIIQPTGN